MSVASELLLMFVIAIDVLGPFCLLLLLKRWTRRWWVGFAVAIIATPGAAFAFTGGMAWLATYHHVVIGGDTSIPDREGLTTSQYLSGTFFICGIYGVMFAVLGLGLALALWMAVEIWRRFVRRRLIIAIEFAKLYVTYLRHS